MRKCFLIFVFASFVAGCSTVSTILESGFDDPVKLLNSAIDDAAVAIQPSIDENFDKEVVAFYEQNESFTNPESSNYDPYFDIRYVIDYENHSITRLSNDSVIKLIKEMNISSETRRIKEEMIEYSIISEWEYEELFATEELRAKNKERYLECWGKLRDLHLAAYYTSKNNPSVNLQGTKEVMMTNVVESDSVAEIVDSEKPNSIIGASGVMHSDACDDSQVVYVVDDYNIDEFELSKNKKEFLLSVCELITCKTIKRITIEGHTCDLGTEKVNNDVGQKRAFAVKDFMVEHGVPCDKMEAKSSGALFPVVDNKINKRKNRRVVITVAMQ